jgi:hypothetical protein
LKILAMSYLLKPWHPAKARLRLTGNVELRARTLTCMQLALMVNDDICKRIAELKAAQAQKSELSRDQLREFLTEVILTPPGQVSEQSRLCQSYKVTPEVREIRMPDKLRPVDQLAKLCGFNEPEKMEIEHGYREREELVEVTARLRGCGAARNPIKKNNL